MDRRSQNGFTIIEILIVLALAAMILLVVFLAVPSLNRNERNTMRKSDARYIAAQRLQYNIDNQTVMNAGEFNCSTPHTSKLFCTYLTKGMTFYDLENVTFSNSGTTAPTTVPTVTDPNKIITDTYYRCDAQNRLAVVAPSARYSVVLYAIETAGGAQQQCLESSVFPL
ncbi:MAG TPA: prepilin-type N-terminal cleavage/methylation domain-containing protein [Candidatus Saccharimonadales bacterium]|nr:prepilin-type N-terminal cleavage/methylation domain-containing protein [Candidatus Saccharimonadales bacterium]